MDACPADPCSVNYTKSNPLLCLFSHLQVVEVAGMITLPSCGQENPCWKVLLEEDPAPRP